MANRIARFEKVSYNQFEKDYKNLVKYTTEFGEPDAKELYRDIKLPARSTRGSAGYDFRSPIYCFLNYGEDIIIPTGIRCRMDDGWGLFLYPKSGLGFKYYTRLANTIGIVDEDYYYSDNEGHILIKIRNESEDKLLIINRGDKFAQGIFTQYGITEDDDVDGIRNGGFGSTGR